MNFSRAILDLQEQEGWNSFTLLNLVSWFLANEGRMEAFEQFLRKVAQSEKERSWE